MLWEIATALPSRPACRQLTIVVPKAAKESKAAAQVDVKTITATQCFAYGCEESQEAKGQDQKSSLQPEAPATVKVQAGLGYYITDTCGRNEDGEDHGEFLQINLKLIPTLSYKHLRTDV